MALVQWCSGFVFAFPNGGTLRAGGMVVEANQMQHALPHLHVQQEDPSTSISQSCPLM